MDKESVIRKTEEHIKEKLGGEGSGHDWWHVYRVWKMAINICKEEKADLFVVQLASLLHDISDWKFNSGNDDVGPKLAREWLEKMQVDGETISHVCNIIKDMSFKGADVQSQMKTKEGMIVQDADRLDAIGAMGIARTFTMGGKFGEIIHEPSLKPKKYKFNPDEKRTSINHFYEKLLLLKDLMNTKIGKKIAEERHKFMKQFLDRFFKEWEGKS